MSVAMFEGLSRDVWYAVRALRRSPTFALTALLTLTFAIGINVGIFATLNGVALRRLPAPKPHELVRLSSSFRTGQEVPFSFPMVRELSTRQHAVEPLTVSTVILLTNAGLLVRSLQRVLTIDFGFESDEVRRASFTTRPGVKERPDRESYYPALLQGVEALPGVSSASI